MSDILLFLTALFAAAPLLLLLALRGRRLRRPALRGIVTVSCATLALATVLVAAIGTLGLVRIYLPRDVPVPVVERLTGDAVLARGRHLAETACAACHGSGGDLPLTGGRNLSREVGMPLGSLHAPNLTPVGGWSRASDGELFRMIRTGIAPNGRATAMALFGNRALDDRDTLALIAFMRQSDGEGEPSPPFEPSPLYALLVGLGRFGIDPAPLALGREAPERAASAAYGRYVAAYMGCAQCHGAAFDGLLDSALPPGPDLQRTGERWTEEAFAGFVRLRGRQTVDSPMPWKGVARLDDLELSALYRALASLGDTPEE